MSVPFILAISYTGVVDRTDKPDEVKRALQSIIGALPTQIRPEDRAALIDAILADLTDEEGAPWTSWPTDVYLLALTALKHLGRNPMGSQPLFREDNLKTLLHHTALPFPPPSSPFSHPPPERDSLHALEALRILGNLLIIHPTARNRVAAAGTPKAVALALANRSGDGEYLEDEDENIDRVFLVSRVGFLVTVGRQQSVKTMVDEDDIVESLAYWLTSVPLIPANFDCLTELCKLSHAVVSTYPNLGADDTPAEKLEPLLWPTLALFHSLPFTDHTPPLPAVLYILLALPWNDRTPPTWHSVPADPPSPSSGAVSSVKSLLNRLSNMSSISSISNSSGNQGRSSIDHGTSVSGNAGGTNGATLAPPRARTPSPPESKGKQRTLILPPKRDSPTALPAKVVKVLEGWLQRWLPGGTHPDALGEDGPRVDEQVPPILMLLVRATAGSDAVRQYLRGCLLPVDLDRSAEAGPLEKRKSLLGHLLRFMGCTTWINSKIAAGELLYEVCGRDASVFSAEIGYGNAAGYLLTQGITAPPPGVVQDIRDDHPSLTGPSSTSATAAGSSAVKEPRNPITAIRDDATPDPTADWTVEQKEAEADRLFSVFDKMERNPVISAQGPNGEKQGVKDALREKYMEVDAGWADKERKEQEEEDERDEREALREMEAYRKRMGRGGAQ